MSEGDSFCWFDRLSGEQKDAALNHMLECIAARNGKLLDLQDSNNLIAEIVHSGAPRAANIFVRHAQQGNGADLVPAIRKCLAQDLTDRRSLSARSSMQPINAARTSNP